MSGAPLPTDFKPSKAFKQGILKISDFAKVKGRSFAVFRFRV
jgi:hypothetical protein